MIVAPQHPREEERLRALYDYRVLDTENEIAYDDIVAIASAVCGAPIAVVSLVDRDRQWFKAKVGIEVPETPRDISFCSHTILQNDVMEVSNALEDERFQDNPLVKDGPRIRFYAGTTLLTPEGHPLGTLCVIDRKPRTLTFEQKNSLAALGRQVMTQLTLRKTVTRLARATQELERSNRDLEVFASVASHDLQEPIRKIRIFVDRLGRRWGDSMSPDAARDVERLASVAGRMQQLVLDLLDLSRLHKKLDGFESIPLQTMAEGALQDLETRIAEAGGSVEIGDLPVLEGEPVLLRQLLVNLVGNSIKFRREGVAPRVEISAEVVEGHQRLDSGRGPLCHLQIRDNGIGFEEQFAERIFGILQRLHGRAEYEGSGIGLALCRRIVEHHRGVIWAESPDDTGAVFHVLLPVSQGGQLPAAA